MSQTISFTISSKYEELVNNDTLVKKIAGEFFEDYLEEYRQDDITKAKLEKNEYDKSLNNQIAQKLGIL